MLQSMELQKVGHYFATEQQEHSLRTKDDSKPKHRWLLVSAAVLDAVTQLSKLAGMLIASCCSSSPGSGNMSVWTLLALAVGTFYGDVSKGFRSQIFSGTI